MWPSDEAGPLRPALPAAAAEGMLVGDSGETSQHLAESTPGSADGDCNGDVTATTGLRTALAAAAFSGVR
jgi:hypothetical protein